MVSVYHFGRGNCTISPLRRSLSLGMLLVLLIAAKPSFAAPANPAQAHKAVQGWLKLNPRPLHATLGAAVARIDTYTDDQGQPSWYVVYLDPAGFVIVPADDDVEPVAAFVAGGTFSLSPSDPLGALVSRDVAGRVKAARDRESQQAGRARPSRRQARWQRLLLAADGVAMAGSAASVSDLRVAPLVASRWNQGNEGSSPCYNYYTPNHYFTGCVATAMAQLMRYYQHPSVGIGVRPFNIVVSGTSTVGQTRGGDGLGGPYNWLQMPLDPDAYTMDVQRQAIGALCYDAGLSVNMNYAAGASSAYNLGETALTSVFGYGNAIRGYSYNGIDPAALTTMINTNLDAALPVLLGILGDVGGHAVIADGYGYSSGVPYHHLNMGWGSYQDAWYNLPDITSSPGPFTTIFECGYNIYVTGSGEIISGRVLDLFGSPIPGATVSARRGLGETYTATTNANGIYALARIASNSTYTISAAAPGYVFAATQTATVGVSLNSSPTTANRWAVDFTQGVLAGDVNSDGQVDVSDLLGFTDSWGAVAGDARFDPACDFNNDGIVDTVDLFMLVDNWGR